MRKGILFAALLCASSAWGVGFQPQVIYGNDDRYDVHQVPNEFVVDSARSTMAVIPVGVIRNSAESLSEIEIASRPYGPSNRLCPDERFFNQPAAANCSAFFIGGDLAVTAGHCIQASTCSRFAFVFGYEMAPDGSAPHRLPANQAYRCKSVVARELANGVDYAVVQLDRPVTDRAPLRLASRPVQVNDPLMVIGHPAGLPTKVAPGAAVRSVNSAYFVTNLDTYGGNSGSAVFDLRTLEVVGILVRGETDFVQDRARSCVVSNRCADGACRGEDVTHISFVGEALRRMGLRR